MTGQDEDNDEAEAEGDETGSGNMWNHDSFQEVEEEDKEDEEPDIVKDACIDTLSQWLNLAFSFEYRSKTFLNIHPTRYLQIKLCNAVQ